MKKRLADFLRYLADKIAPATWYNTDVHTGTSNTTFVTFNYLDDKQQ